MTQNGEHANQASSGAAAQAARISDSDAHSSTFRKAAQKALFEWGREDGVEELLQELWVWFLERPGTQAQFDEQDEPLNRTMAHRAAIQLLTKQALEDDVFNGKPLYSTDSIKQALRGESSNKYLRQILPIALERLGARNEIYAESLRGRYDDETVPSGAEADRLHHAVKALTDEVNVLYLTSDDTGASRRDPTAPNTRRNSGSYSDPTSGIALMLLDNPDERTAFYEDLEDWRVDVREDEPASDPINIMDSAFNGMPRSELYRAQVFPELYPHELPMRVEQWPKQDRAEYCGGIYAEG